MGRFSVTTVGSDLLIYATDFEAKNLTMIGCMPEMEQEDLVHVEPVSEFLEEWLLAELHAAGYHPINNELEELVASIRAQVTKP